MPLLDPGHALFEMAAGYEMSTTKPTDKNYNDVEHCPEVYQVLRFIFESGNHHYPTLEEVSGVATQCRAAASLPAMGCPPAAARLPCWTSSATSTCVS